MPVDTEGMVRGWRRLARHKCHKQRCPHSGVVRVIWLWRAEGREDCQVVLGKLFGE